MPENNFLFVVVKVIVLFLTFVSLSGFRILQWELVFLQNPERFAPLSSISSAVN